MYRTPLQPGVPSDVKGVAHLGKTLNLCQTEIPPCKCCSEVNIVRTVTVNMVIILRGNLHVLGGGGSNSSTVWSKTSGWASSQDFPLVWMLIVTMITMIWMMIVTMVMEIFNHDQVDGQEIPTDGCSAQLSSHQILLSGGRACPTCAFVYDSNTGVFLKIF